MFNKLLSTSLLLSAMSAPAFASDIEAELKSANKSVSEKVIKWRRHLHQ